MKRLILILLIILALPLSSEGRRVTFGCEWGSGVTYARYHVYNYLYESGRRHQGKEFESVWQINANFMVHAGYDISRRVNLSFYSGFEGISKGESVVPLTLRATVFPGGSRQDGFLAYLDCGAGFDRGGYHALLSRAGLGYRLCLTEVTNLDFLLSYRLAITHPELRDPDSWSPIDENRIAWNNLFINKVSFSIGLNF